MFCLHGGAFDPSCCAGPAYNPLTVTCKRMRFAQLGVWYFVLRPQRGARVGQYLRRRLMLDTKPRLSSPGWLRQPSGWRHCRLAQPRAQRGDRHRAVAASHRREDCQATLPAIAVRDRLCRSAEKGRRRCAAWHSGCHGNGGGSHGDGRGEGRCWAWSCFEMVWEEAWLDIPKGSDGKAVTRPDLRWMNIASYGGSGKKEGPFWDFFHMAWGILNMLTWSMHHYVLHWGFLNAPLTYKQKEHVSDSESSLTR